MTQANPLSGPWQNCAADILGPLPSGENLLVIVDYYSRYFEVVILRSTTSTKYQENGTSESESESVAPLQPTASPISMQQTVNPSSAML
ncbi:unnamed protein product [Porites evermanni]|uniref:Uncharacterized protein n=1 Tax=Porites evermanni TaxID=104178 RepID=A0ABN8LCK7_9CNID|nr:unnamed protein product [Porites evermanni]